MIKVKSALIIGFGRMGQVYFNILKNMGVKNIEVIEKNNKNIKIDALDANELTNQFHIIQPQVVK